MHVGLPKTGTTHLQSTFAANRASLKAQGLLYPQVDSHPQHFLPVLDFLQTSFGAVRPEDVAGLWDRLRAVIDEWDGPVLISHELLAGATEDDIERMVGQFASRPVHAIVTVRDLSRLLPAVWQERAKNRVIEDWTSFRTGVAEGPDVDEPHAFWRLHDVERVVRSWQRAIASDRIHVVTVPNVRTDEDALLMRFCSVVGIDPQGFVAASDAANASIGGLELAVLRAVNAAAADKIDRAAYTTLIKRYLVPKVLAKRPHQTKVAMPRSDESWLAERSAAVAALLTGCGVDIVGSLDDLEPTGFVSVDAPAAVQNGEFDAEIVNRALAEVVIDLLTANPPTKRQPRPAPSPPGRVARSRRRARAVGRAIRRRMVRRSA